MKPQRLRFALLRHPVGKFNKNWITVADLVKSKMRKNGNQLNISVTRITGITYWTYYFHLSSELFMIISQLMTLPIKEWQTGEMFLQFTRIWHAFKSTLYRVHCWPLTLCMSQSCLLSLSSQFPRYLLWKNMDIREKLNRNSEKYDHLIIFADCITKTKMATISCTGVCTEPMHIYTCANILWC